MSAQAMTRASELADLTSSACGLARSDSRPSGTLVTLAPTPMAWSWPVDGAAVAGPGTGATSVSAATVSPGEAHDPPTMYAGNGPIPAAAGSVAST